MQNIENYILSHTEPEDDVLYELYRETNLKVNHSRMLSGHLQGKILEHISKMVKPNSILELGTYTGYSAICLAKGLRHNGTLHTIEQNDELESIIYKYIKKSKLEDKIVLHIGDANKIIENLNLKFDIIFIDADKRDYLKYYKLVFDKLNKGGYIIADNILWSNKVVEKVSENDSQTKGILEFNDFVHSDKRVENVILPIRDGLMLLRKK